MKSHLHYYMTGWGLVFGVLIIIQRFFPRISQDIWGGYLLVMWILYLIVSYYEVHRVESYLKKWYPSVWEKFFHHSIRFLHYRFNSDINILTTIPFIFSQDTHDDPHIRWCKQYCQRIIIFGIVIVLQMFICGTYFY